MKSTHVLSFDPATNHNAYCLVNKNTLHPDDWDVFSIESPTYEGRSKNLKNELDKRKEILQNKNNLNDNLLEQQMGINTKTNRINGMIIMYYTINNENINKIVHYASKYKLNYYEWKVGDPKPYIIINSKGKKQYYLNERIAKLKGSNYYKNKQNAIEQCRRLIGPNHLNLSKKWVDFFEKSKKKDDLADSYIQALSYIKYPSGNNNKIWWSNYEKLENKEDYKKEDYKNKKEEKEYKEKELINNDYIINPDTNRKVKKSSKKGKEILKKQKEEENQLTNKI